MGDEPLHQPSKPLPPLDSTTRAREHPAWLRGVYAGFFLYLFICAIKVMGSGLKMMANAPPTNGWIEETLSGATNPFAALTAAVLVTAIVQSSSFTTSMIITMAATGVIKVDTAVFAVMGANIGTSVTGIIVALFNMRIRRQFRRAFSAALVHDIFNLLTVSVLLPIEWAFGILGRAAGFIAQGMGFQTQGKPTSPLKVITSPVVDFFEWVAGLIFSNPAWVGLTVAIGGLLLLFVALVMMVTNLKGALLQRIEGLFRSVFFRNDVVAGVVGTITTVLVQSSSVTTSLIVPLAGAGAVTLRRVFPFMLGANVGTTVTGIIAAAATDNKQLAFTIAFCHVLFNIVGIGVWYPLREVPIGLAGWYGRLAARSKRYAFLFLLTVFVVIPAIGLLITELLTSSSPAP
ncbi:MAG: Na/Pi symporter [Planctomycetota bacterium]|jgi:sodium-dependent phosphate cotransporter